MLKSALLTPNGALLFLLTTRSAVSLDLAERQHRPNGTKYTGGCPKARRERHCSLRSRRYSVGRHCCVCSSAHVRHSSWPQAHSRPQVNDRVCRKSPAFQRPPPTVSCCDAHGRLVSMKSPCSSTGAKVWMACAWVFLGRECRRSGESCSSHSGSSHEPVPVDREVF